MSSEAFDAIAREFGDFCQGQGDLTAADSHRRRQLIDSFLSSRQKQIGEPVSGAELQQRLSVVLQEFCGDTNARSGQAGSSTLEDERANPDNVPQAADSASPGGVDASEYFPPLPSKIAGGNLAKGKFDSSRASASAVLPLPVRYESVGKIGEGGLGQIWRVRDQKLNRVVAIKSLRTQWFAKPHTWERLLREAELAGKLQHPGVPPLYDSGSLDNGVPFFSMKLVEGKTLAELLRQSAECGSPTDSQLLSYFSHVAQTIAYAHQQGIIHRDLKPQNIMVGQFGEVQVMDWGLAKRLGDADSLDLKLQGGESEALAEPTASMTGVGDVLGTPSYMPPEQARGERDRVDQRSDVYSLGAMLYELLTRKRLFAECSTSDDVLVAVASSDLRASLRRLQDCDAEQQLKDLVRSCLSADPNDRPENGAAVASELAAYFERRDRKLREAKEEQAKAALMIEEEKKRRRIALGLVAVLVAGIVGTAFGLYRAQNQWRRAEFNAAEAIENERLAVANAKTADANAKTAAANAKEAEANAQKAEANALEAKVNADKAEQNAIAAEKVVQDFYSRVSEEKLFDTPSLQPLRQEFLDSALEFYAERLEESPDNSRVRYAHGELLYRSANATLSRGEIQAAFELNEQAIEQLESLKDLPAAQEGVPDFAEWAKPILGRAYFLRGVAMMRMGKGPACIEWFEKSEALLVAAAADKTADVKANRYLGELYSAWGDLMASSPQPSQAMPLFEKAKMIREEVLATDDANEYDTYSLARTFWDIGYCQRRMSSRVPSVDEWDKLLQQALGNYGRAVEMLEQLIEEHPESLAFMTTLGDVYNTIAVAHSHKNDRGGRAKEERVKNNENALAAYQKMMVVQQRLVDENPGIERLEYNLGRAYLGLSTQYKFLERFDEAEVASSKAVEIRRRLVDKNPGSIQYMEGLGNALTGLGLLQIKMSKGTDAYATLQESEELYRKLIEKAPGSDRFLGNLSMTIANVGLAHQELGEFKAASEKMLEAAEVNPGQPDRAFTIARCQALLAKAAAESSEPDQQLVLALQQQAAETLGSLRDIKFLSEKDLRDAAFESLVGNEDYDALRREIVGPDAEPSAEK